MPAAKGLKKKRSEDEQKAELATVLPAKHVLEQQERLQRIKDDLLERSLNIVDASVRFAELDPDSEEPPPSWIRQYGLEEARVRARIARTGWLPTKDAPSGVKTAAAVAIGIMRANAQEKAAPVAINIAVVKMTAPMPEFLERDIEVGR